MSNNSSVEDILDLSDPAMDMVDSYIDDMKDAEFELESCLSEPDMILVEVTADSMEGVPGYELGKEDLEEEKNPLDGINLF